MDEVTEMHAKILEYRKAYNIDERQKEILSIQHNAVTAYTNVTMIDGMRHIQNYQMQKKGFLTY